MRRLLFLSFLLCCVLKSSAQGDYSVLVLGALQGAEQQVVRLEADKKYLNNTIEEYATIANEQGQFGFVLTLEFPQTLTLYHKNKRLELFAAPGDTIQLQGNTAYFPDSVLFIGKTAASNTCWQEYKRRFAPNVPIFEQINYKKGIYYYHLHDKLDSAMRHTPSTSFVIGLERKRKNTKDWLSLGYPFLPATFRQFIQTDIDCQYWLSRLAYGHIYRNKHQLDDSYFSVFDTLNFRNDAALGNAGYRDLMMAFLNYHYEKQVKQLPTTPDIFKGEYELAKQLYTRKTLYFSLAYLVEKAVRTEYLENVIDLYEDFLKTNPYLELDKIATDAYQRVRPFTAGLPAPTFFLPDTLGNGIGLRDFQGKTVYLGFWASWCRPCLKKMQELEQLKTTLNGQNVVFIHISLDKQTEQWRETIARNGFTGVHLMAAPPTTVLDDYKIFSVPKFFIITKDGNFTQTPSGTDLEELEKVLSNGK